MKTTLAALNNELKWEKLKQVYVVDSEVIACKIAQMQGEVLERPERESLDKHMTETFSIAASHESTSVVQDCHKMSYLF